MCLLVAALVALSGCGRVGYGLDERVADGGPDDAPARDAAADASGAADAGPLDAGPPDAGPPGFYALDWDPPSEVPGVDALDRCNRDPVLTPDERFMFLTRAGTAGGNCYAMDPVNHTFEWAGGAPTELGRLPDLDPTSNAEHNLHPIVGPTGVRLFVTTQDWDVWAIDLDAAPPFDVAGPPVDVGINTGLIEADATTTSDGSRLVFVRDAELYETTATPGTLDFGGPVARAELNSTAQESDPALSPDGRVIVFTRTGASNDLWIARRLDPADPFEPPERMSDVFNTTGYESDAFITASGDLLYIRETPAGSRVHFARARM